MIERDWRGREGKKLWGEGKEEKGLARDSPIEIRYTSIQKRKVDGSLCDFCQINLFFLYRPHFFACPYKLGQTVPFPPAVRPGEKSNERRRPPPCSLSVHMTSPIREVSSSRDLRQK